MPKKTAVTEEIPYSTEPCHICGEEVATAEIPEEEISHPGYAVLIGGGQINHQSEQKGNWDKEIHFTLDDEETAIPTVEGYIICEPCAGSIHDYNEEGEYFTGEIPAFIDPLVPMVGEPGSTIEKRILIYAIVASVIFLVLILIIL